MPANKKPRKKYVPKTVYRPNLINQMSSFDTFEKALDRLLETGQSEVDAFGSLTFMGSDGNVQSFESTLRVYVQVLDLCVSRKLFFIDSTSLSILHNRMFERTGFDEEEILAAKVTLNKAKALLSGLNSTVVRDILRVVRISIGVSSEQEVSLSKNPREALDFYRQTFGKLSYEDVIERNERYQKLADEHPDDNRIVATRNIYMKYLAAYNFVRIEEKRKEIDRAIGL